MENRKRKAMAPTADDELSSSIDLVNVVRDECGTGIAQILQQLIGKMDKLKLEIAQMDSGQNRENTAIWKEILKINSHFHEFEKLTGGSHGVDALIGRWAAIRLLLFQKVNANEPQQYPNAAATAVDDLVTNLAAQLTDMKQHIEGVNNANADTVAKLRSELENMDRTFKEYRAGMEHRLMEKDQQVEGFQLEIDSLKECNQSMLGTVSKLESDLSDVTKNFNEYRASQMTLENRNDRRTGQIVFKIVKFSEFAREADNTRRLSDAVCIRCLPWKILICIKVERQKAKRKCLSFFVQCNDGNKDGVWNCAATCELKILAQKKGKQHHVRNITHVFCAKENDWGFAFFMTFEKIMDPESGWYNEQTDSIIVSANIVALA